MIIIHLINLVGSLQVGDVNTTTETKDSISLLFSFIITVLSSVKKFMLFKEKIENMENIEQLEILIDNINTVYKELIFYKLVIKNS